MKSKMKNKKKGLDLLQQGCNEVSNHQRMNTTRGKKAAEEAEKLAEQMLAKMMTHEDGIRGAVIATAAVAMVRAYLRKAIVMEVGPEALKDADDLESLFLTDCWMSLHNDYVQNLVDDFVRGGM